MTTCTNCLVVLAVLGYAATQYLAPPMAGTSIGTNYHTDDSSRQETIDADGNVQGQYSYVDPNGKTINVQYTAGKDGFKIVGEHVPIPTPQIIPSVPQQSYYQSQRGYQPSYRNYNQRFASQYPQDLQGFQSQAQAVYQSQEYQPKFTQALFSPAQDPYPAGTAGQLKSLQDYLEEERMEIEKEKQKKKPPAQAYASVNTPNQEYSYNINL